MKKQIHSFIALVTLTFAAVEAEAAPANDNFANAILFAGDSGYHQGSTVASTTEVAEPSSGGAGTIWYRWTSLPHSAVLTVSLKRAPSTGWHYLDVYQANGGANINALTLIERDGSTSAGSSDIATVRFTASANQLYYIRLSYASGSPGVTEVSLDYSPKDSWGAYYQSANSYYAYYANLGQSYNAYANYYYLIGMGDYAYHTAFGRTSDALYSYYNGYALYYYYALYGQGKSKEAFYYYYVHLGYAYYNYFIYKGQNSNASLYYNFFVNQANASLR